MNTLTRKQKNLIKKYAVKTSYSYEKWLEFVELIKHYDIYFDVSLSECFLEGFYELSLEQNRDLIDIGEDYNKEMKNTLSGIGIQIRENLSQLGKAIIKEFHIPKKLIKGIFGIEMK